MNKLLFLFLSLVTFSLFGADSCATKAKNSATLSFAEENNLLVQNVLIINYEVSSWKNEDEILYRGRLHVTVGHRSRISKYTVRVKQLVGGSDCIITETVRNVSASSIEKQASRYKLAIGNALYMSESDEMWEPFYTDKKVDKIFSLDLVKDALDAGRSRIVTYSYDEVMDLFRQYVKENPYDDHSESVSYIKLLEIMKRDFGNQKSIRIFEVGVSTIDLYLVGRNSDGRLVGLKTTVID